MHPRLIEKHFAWEFPACPRCGSEEREFDLSPARIARGRRRAHGGKLGWKCLKCGHLQPMVLTAKKAL